MDFLVWVPARVLRSKFNINNITECCSYNHRIVWVGRDTWRSPVLQLLCSEKGQLHQGAQSPVQPDFECLQGWGIHHISGQTVPVPHHPHCQRLFLISNLHLHSLSWKSFPLVLSPPTLLTSLYPSFLQPPFRYWKDAIRFFFGVFSSLGWAAPAVSACSHRRDVPFIGSLLWPSSGCAPAGPCLICKEDSPSGCSTQERSHQHRAEGQDPLTCWPCFFSCSQG